MNEDLEQRLAAARERVRELSSNLRSDTMQAWQQALQQLLQAERDLAAARGEQYAKVIDIGPRFGGPLGDSRLYRLPSGDEVWLEREGASHPLDDLVIERFGIAATVALGRGHRDIGDLGRAALLQLAISTGTPDSGRRRALEQLGIRVTSTVHVLAMAGTTGDWTKSAAACRENTVRGSA